MPEHPYVCDWVTCISACNPIGSVVVAYLWEIEGPATNTSAMDEEIMTFHCDGPGTVAVTLTAWDDLGDSETETKQIEQNEHAPPVGGIWIPVNKLELLAPYIGLTILLAVALVTVVYVKKRKRHTEINS